MNDRNSTHNITVLYDATGKLNKATTAVSGRTKIVKELEEWGSFGLWKASGREGE